MPENDKQLKNTVQGDSTLSVDEACHLLDVSRQGIQQDKEIPKVAGRRGRVGRDQVIGKHLAKTRELEQALERMRLAARHAGINSPPIMSTTSQLDNSLLETIAQRMDGILGLAGSQTDRALMQVEIDRLKSEIRRANVTITLLSSLVETSRPAEDIGLDEIR